MAGGEAQLRRPVRMGQLTGRQITEVMKSLALQDPLTEDNAGTIENLQSLMLIGAATLEPDGLMRRKFGTCSQSAATIEHGAVAMFMR